MIQTSYSGTPKSLTLMEMIDLLKEFSDKRIPSEIVGTKATIDKLKSHFIVATALEHPEFYRWPFYLKGIPVYERGGMDEGIIRVLDQNGNVMETIDISGI